MKRRFLAMLLSVAMVLTMLPVTAFAADTPASNGTVALAELTQLTVRAIKATGANGKITLKVTATEGNSEITDFYYKTAASGTITAPTEGTAITTSGDDAWTEYTGPFDVTAEPAEVGVVAVTVTDDKLLPTSYGSTNSIYNALGELTVEVADNNISVKEGSAAVTTGLKYYALAADKLNELNTAKADWASDTALTELTSTLSASEIAVTEGASASITKGESGKYIVVVETGTGSDNSTTVITSLGVTEKPVKFVKPFKLFLGEGNSVGTVDQIADIEEDNGTYTVTVPAGTEKVTVDGTDVTATTSTTGASVATDGKVVTLATDAATTITVSVGQGQSETYTVVVSPVVPVVKNGKTNTELTPLTRNGSTYTHTPELDHDVEFVTVSGPEGGCKVTSVKNDTATTTNGTVYLNDGTNNLEVSFDDGGKCTVVITRKAAAPAVALYEGEKATGTDLLAELTADQNNVYEVSVPSTVEKVTVGAKASTIASVTYTPTGGSPTTGNTVTLNEGTTAITVTFNDGDPATTFTINVTKAKAFVPLKVTKADDGKVVVARAEGTGEVPTGLSVVTLAKEPTWDATTTAAQVTTDTTNALVGSVAYNADTTTAPAAGESDKYVVVYKVEDGLVVAFGVMMVEKEERSITVNATDTDTGLLNFDSSIHEYTISIPADVANATVVCGPGAARISCDTEITDNVVAKKTGEVSTVTVTFTGVENGVYTIKLVWAKAVGDITDNNQIVTATPTEGNVNLVEDDILQAISSTSAVNEGKKLDNPVQITATTTEGETATTTVTLPASAAELLNETGIDAKVVTDAGEVTIPSEAIAQTQPGTEDSPAAPVAIAVVVAKKEVATPTEGGIVEAAKFEVTVKKADADGVMEATNITDLQKPITLVFKVLKTTIGEMKNPRLAHVKTEGGKTTYEKLTNAAPTESGEYYVFTEKTSHLSEFAVVAEEATTEPVTPGPNITDITLTDGENPIFGFEFKTGTDTYNVTVPSTTTHASVTVTADSYTDISVNGTPITSTKNTVGADIEDGEVTFEVKIGNDVKYTINVKQENDTSVKEITNIKLTAKDGTTAVAGFTFAKTTYEYPNVVTDITPVLVTVEGDTDNVTVNDAKYTEPVEVVPTADGTKVTIAYGDGTAQKYEITLKTKSTTPVDPTAPVSNTVLVGSTEYTVEFGDANAKGERISKETLTMESTDETVTLTIADGAKVKLDDVEATGVSAGNTYTVTVEDAGDHTITVTDSKGNNPYIIKLNKKLAVVDENQPSIGDGETGTLEFDKTNEDGSKENTTPITVANSASSYKLNVAAGAKVTVDGVEFTASAPGGEITIPITASGAHKIEIVNSDGSKYIVNLEKQAAPGGLTIAQNGTVNIFAKVEISNIKTGKYYLVKIDVPATVARAASYSYLILDGNGYTSGTATIAPASGSKILVEEYDSMADLASFNSSLKTDSATWTVR